MDPDEDRKAELLRRFEAAISGAELDDLRQMTADLALLGVPTQPRRQRANLRRPPLPDLKVFRIRVDLRQAQPPIWRRLNVRSDLTLDVLHRVLQTAFSWTDTHLWRFSLGGDPFDRASQIFLCQWDVDEGEHDDEGGVPAAGVRLDETIQAPGDVLSYVYDYGDNWELTVKLEEVSDAPRDIASATVIDGRRAAPPEDCGSRRNAEELAEILDDPAQLNIEELNGALRGPFMLLIERGFNRRVVNLIDRLAYSAVGDDLTRRAVALLSEPASPGEQLLRDSFSAFSWFLDRAGEAPIQLTTTGYLKPVDVEQIAQVLPTMGGWIGKANREDLTTPVLTFRELLQSIGLLRKYKRSLRLTRAGVQAQRAPEELFNVLADRLAAVDDEFIGLGTLLLLVYAATSAEAVVPLDQVAAGLNHLGWRVNGRDEIQGYDLFRIPALQVLENVADHQVRRATTVHISSVAACLARASLIAR